MTKATTKQPSMEQLRVCLTSATDDDDDDDDDVGYCCV